MFKKFLIVLKKSSGFNPIDGINMKLHLYLQPWIYLKMLQILITTNLPRKLPSNY